MKTKSSFVQPSIPKLDGHYDRKPSPIKRILDSGGARNLCKRRRNSFTGIKKKAIEDLKLKDLKTKNYLFQAIDRPTLDTILRKALQTCTIASSSQRVEGYDMIRNHYKGSKIRITLLIEYLKPRTLCLRFESLKKQDRSCLASMILVDQISQDKNT